MKHIRKRSRSRTKRNYSKKSRKKYSRKYSKKLHKRSNKRSKKKSKKKSRSMKGGAACGCGGRPNKSGGTESRKSNTGKSGKSKSRKSKKENCCFVPPDDTQYNCFCGKQLRRRKMSRLCRRESVRRPYAGSR